VLATQTDEDNSIDIMQQQCQALQELVLFQQHQIASLQQLTTSKFGYSSIADKDMLFYMGTNRALFDCIVAVCKDSLPVMHDSVSFNDHLLIVFLKLRLGLLNKDIADRFAISPASVFNILRVWIPALAMKLKAFIVWPDRDILRLNAPASFKPQFKNVISIIDCFEVLTERPYNLTARAQTPSSYKHNNTVKYLISITPVGSVSFISEGWHGRVSDKQITLESGYMQKLVHGDEIMADRSFLIRDECAACGVSVHLPSFPKGKKQLSAKDIIQSRKLSAVHMHVGHVIRKMRQFQILQTTVPVAMISLLNDIVVLIAAIVNMKPSRL